MREHLVDALLPFLSTATRTPQHCHFGLWNGWGDLHRGSQAMLQAGTSARELVEARRSAGESALAFVDACAVQPWWGGRTMWLFDGPIQAVTPIGAPSGFDGSLRRRAPQWWWPTDDAWFVGSEIDYPWTYLRGSAQLIESIHGDSRIESVQVKHSDLWSCHAVLAMKGIACGKAGRRPTSGHG